LFDLYEKKIHYGGKFVFPRCGAGGRCGSGGGCCGLEGIDVRRV